MNLISKNMGSEQLEMDAKRVNQLKIQDGVKWERSN